MFSCSSKISTWVEYDWQADFMANQIRLKEHLIIFTGLIYYIKQTSRKDYLIMLEFYLGKLKIMPDFLAECANSYAFLSNCDMMLLCPEAISYL
jgi:hypothetical protein